MVFEDNVVCYITVTWAVVSTQMYVAVIYICSNCF